MGANYKDLIYGDGEKEWAEAYAGEFLGGAKRVHSTLYIHGSSLNNGVDWVLRCYLVQQEIQEVEEGLDFHFRVAEFPVPMGHAGGDVQSTGV